MPHITKLVMWHFVVICGKNKAKISTMRTCKNGAWQDFLQIVKAHVFVRGEVLSIVHLKNTFNEIRSEQGLKGCSSSRDVKAKLKESLGKKIN